MEEKRTDFFKWLILLYQIDLELYVELCGVTSDCPTEGNDSPAHNVCE